MITSEYDWCNSGLFSFTLEETKPIGESSRRLDLDSVYREPFQQSSLVLVLDCRASCHWTYAYKERLGNYLGKEVGRDQFLAPEKG